MADIIDSLKRLERVGSENSKTTEKLIGAAIDLSNLICKQFDPRPGDSYHIQFPVDPGCIKTQFGTVSNNPSYYYVTLVKGEMCLFDSHNEFVGKNRETALKLAKNIANGFLEQVNRVLEETRAEAAPALSTLESAVQQMKVVEENARQARLDAFKEEMGL
jgi:hypothetical protein